MKKFFTYIIVISSVFMSNAQDEIMKIIFTNGNEHTYKINEIAEITFDTISEEPDTIIFKEFTGYSLVTTKYFTDSYYAGVTKLSVCTVGKEYVVKYSDPTWGNAVFSNVTVGKELNGTGYIDMPNNGGAVKRYEATITGSMTTPVITIPSVMGGCAIKFMLGNAPAALEYAGSYSGTNTVVVGGQFTYKADIEYEITSNSNGTVNLLLPEYQLTGTIMGDLTLGAYTIANIEYDKNNDCFYRMYGEDGIKEHFKAVNQGNTTIDADYVMTGDCEIKITKTNDGITVENRFSLGAMPFPIVATFQSSK